VDIFLENSEFENNVPSFTSTHVLLHVTRKRTDKENVQDGHAAP
jgi:hypothetical protein